jgi:hypothetical protein
MTRVCCVCEKVLGEKCPECGGDAITVRSPHTPRNVYHCPAESCPVLAFIEGQGGITSGYCAECFDAVRRQVDGDAQGPAASAATPEIFFDKPALKNQKVVEIRGLSNREGARGAAARFAWIVAAAFLPGGLLLLLLPRVRAAFLGVR